MSFTQTKLQRDFPALQLNSWKVTIIQTENIAEHKLMPMHVLCNLVLLTCLTLMRLQSCLTRFTNSVAKQILPSMLAIVYMSLTLCPRMHRKLLAHILAQSLSSTTLGAVFVKEHPCSRPTIAIPQLFNYHTPLTELSFCSCGLLSLCSTTSMCL